MKNLKRSTPSNYKSLYPDYQIDPVNTKIKLMYDPVLSDTFSSCLYTLIVMISDGYLEIRKSPERNKIIRFFEINLKFSIEIQELISLKAFKRKENRILMDDVILAFKHWFLLFDANL